MPKPEGVGNRNATPSRQHSSQHDTAPALALKLAAELSNTNARVVSSKGPTPYPLDTQYALLQNLNALIDHVANKDGPGRVALAPALRYGRGQSGPGKVGQKPLARKGLARPRDYTRGTRNNKGHTARKGNIHRRVHTDTVAVPGLLPWGSNTAHPSNPQNTNPTRTGH